MTAITPHIRVLRAVSSAMHIAAEERMPRKGKTVAFPDEGAARVLGSMAQAFEWAADALEAEEQALIDRFAGPQPKGH